MLGAKPALTKRLPLISVSLSVIRHIMNKTSRALTELEAAILAKILKNQPCTPYFVMKQHKLSPTPYFRDSAGSVYPAIERLISRKFVTARQTANGKRRAKLLRCTKSGEKQVNNWFFRLAPEDMFLQDLLRSRLMYLGALSRADQRDWLSKAMHSVTKQKELLREYHSVYEESDQYDKLAHLNAEMLIEARLKWLRAVEKRLLS